MQLIKLSVGVFLTSVNTDLNKQLKKNKVIEAALATSSAPAAF